MDFTAPTFYDLENNDATMEVGDIYKLKGLFGSHKFFEGLTIKSMIFIEKSMIFIDNLLLKSPFETSNDKSSVISVCFDINYLIIQIGMFI